MEEVKTFLETVRLARKQSHLNMTLFPLMAPDECHPDYLTLEQALDLGAVKITEMDEEGSIPELKLINSSKKTVLIIEGEELVGAKQNRIPKTQATNVISRGIDLDLNKFNKEMKLDEGPTAC